MITSEAINAWFKGKQEADTRAKFVAVYVSGCVPDCSQLTPEIVEMAKKAANFYSTPFDAKD